MLPDNFTVVNLRQENPDELIVELTYPTISFLDRVDFTLEVLSGEELLQDSDNLTFMVETSDDGIRVATQKVTLSDSSTSAIIFFTHYSDDTALEGTEEFELRLVPLPPWNQTAGVQVVVQNTIKFRITDSDSMLSMSRTTVEV